MGERGRMSQVSVNEVSCMCLESLPPKGHPAFPFIDQGKGLGYNRETERKRNRRKRKNREEERPRAASSFFSRWSCR
jgi:hypothetical protein